MTLPLLRLRDSGPQWPYSVAQFRADEPSLSISADPHDAELASYAELQPPILVCRPLPTDPPPHDPATHRAEEVLPVQAPDGSWQQAWKLVALPPPQPQPDWGTFRQTLLISADVAEVMGAARAAGCEPAATALPSALDKAEAGRPAEFAACWAMVARFGQAGAEMIEFLAAVAEACHLPADFVAALNPSPDLLIRARDAEGRFIPDDPTTPENEAWVPAE